MVVHGPGAFDCGDAAWLAGRIRPREVLVAGVMARCAALVSGLPVRCTDTRPSAVLNTLTGRAFLVNRGKTPESGRIFGEIVAARTDAHRGLVHVECSSRTIYLWNGGDRSLARDLAVLTGYAVVEANGGTPAAEGVRTIRGCIPGEAVFVNGIVIGKATDDTVVLASRNGQVEAVSGLAVKAHGLEKLARSGAIDIRTAWCKSGSVRAAAPTHAERGCTTGQIAVIDHAGHTLYQEIERGTCGVLSIGDDTTAVCGHICSHYGIPVFGVIDGDADAIVTAGYAPGSVVVEVLDGRDDDVGVEVAAALDESASWDNWVAETLSALAGRVRIVVDLRGGKHAVR
jgi:hypothetical protein